MRIIGPLVKQISPRIAEKHETKPSRVYLSLEWRGLMSRLLTQRGRRCEACGRTGCRIFGDHIHELKDGGAALDPGNVRLLCGPCHSTKTARVRAVRWRETV